MKDRFMQAIKNMWETISSKNFMAFLALIGFGFAIYQTYFYEKSKSLTISQSAFNKVFDVYQPVGGLEISYAGENLRTTKKVLWAANLTIINSGQTGIKIDDFDSKAPLGVEIQGGDIVDNPKYLASNDYLQKELEPKVTKNKITFSSVIIEPKDFVNVSLLILGSEEAKPKINAIGVIAGIGRVTEVSTMTPISDKSIWRSAIEADSLLIQMVRYFTYAFGGTMLIAASMLIISLPISIVSETLAKRKRERVISTFKENEDVCRESRYLIDLYSKNGITPIKKIWELLEGIKKYNEISEKLGNNVDNDMKEYILESIKLGKRNRMRGELIEREMLSFNANIAKYEPDLEKSLNELMKFLEIENFKSELDKVNDIYYEIIQN